MKKSAICLDAAIYIIEKCSLKLNMSEINLLLNDLTTLFDLQKTQNS